MREKKNNDETVRCAPESDAALIDRALAEDDGAFEVLYRRHRDRVRAIVHRCTGKGDEAEDLVQVVFMKAFQGLADFRGQAAFSTWLTRIALNVCTSCLRTRRTQRNWVDEADDAVPALQARWHPAPHEDPEAAMVRKERREIVMQGIQALPDRQREAVWLHYVRERSYGEIVAELKVPIGTLKVWLYRGRHRLRGEVERLGVTGSLQEVDVESRRVDEKNGEVSCVE